MDCCKGEVEPSGNSKKVRECTDVFWLCLYLLFWFVMVLIAVFSFVYGNPLRLVNGYDSFGNTCGTNNKATFGDIQLSGMDMRNRKYLIYYNIKELQRCLKICVKECPKRTFNKMEELQGYYLETGTSFCEYNFNYSDFKSNKVDNKFFSSSFGPCPVLPVFESVPVLNRCVPKPTIELAESVFSNIYGLLNNWDMFEQILGDLYNTWREIISLTFVSLGISLLVILILHLLAHLVSYIIMVVTVAVSVAGTVFLWFTYFDIKYKLDKTKKTMLLLESARNETAFLWYSIVATVITVIILLLVIFVRKQVSFLAGLFRETSRCVRNVPWLLLQPFITFAILLVFFAFWILVMLCLATAYYPGIGNIATTVNEPSESSFATPASKVGFLEKLGNLSGSDIKKFTVVEYIDPTWVKYMWWIYLIGLIWTSEFIMACQQMVIAGSVAHWYYQSKYENKCHVSYAICKLVKYHLGSVACGSLLITVFKLPRLILMYLYERSKLSPEGQNECIRCACKCCICCFYCLEKFLRYLNHNAYTVIAIDGKNFCSAARTAFEVLTSHVLQITVINGLGDFILFLGKCFVTAATGCIGLYIFRRDPELHFYAAPTLVVCIFSFFIAHCVLSLYEMVLDTVYLCICQNEGSPEAIQLQNLGMAAKNGDTSSPATELL